MKIYSIFHRFVFLMAVLIFSMPLVTLAQENLGKVKIVAAAEAHAEADINKTTWFFTGCFWQHIWTYLCNRSGAVHPCRSTSW